MNQQGFAFGVRVVGDETIRTARGTPENRFLEGGFYTVGNTFDLGALIVGKYGLICCVAFATGLTKGCK
jgi:hypothetical protein